MPANFCSKQAADRAIRCAGNMFNAMDARQREECQRDFRFVVDVLLAFYQIFDYDRQELLDLTPHQEGGVPTHPR